MVIYLLVDNMLSKWHTAYMSNRDAITELILEAFQLNGRLLAAGDALVRDLGLTSARWQVLGAVAMSPVPLPVAHIARNMGLTRQAVQRLVNELEAVGIVRFASNPHHQRAKLVLLTEHGAALYAEARARQTPWATGLAEGMSKEAITAATNLLREMRRRLEAQNGYGGEENEL
jgi:DNA-binding MarR family transcriptional regulator